MTLGAIVGVLVYELGPRGSQKLDMIILSGIPLELVFGIDCQPQ